MPAMGGDGALPSMASAWAPLPQPPSRRPHAASSNKSPKPSDHYPSGLYGVPDDTIRRRNTDYSRPHRSRGDLDNLLAKSDELRVRPRIATGVGAHTLQQPLARVAKVQRRLVGASFELVRAHRDLSNHPQKMGLGVICPKAAELNDSALHLDRWLQ
jgi:hypothetical protein